MVCTELAETAQCFAICNTMLGRPNADGQFGQSPRPMGDEAGFQLAATSKKPAGSSSATSASQAWMSGQTCLLVWLSVSPHCNSVSLTASDRDKARLSESLIKLNSNHIGHPGKFRANGMRCQ